MAVEKKPTQPTSTKRRWLVGTNVVVMIVLVIAIVVFLQAMAYSTPARWDMTSSGVNSLSEGTENLLRDLDQNIRLTSLYFETDREEEDQQRYRQAARNLLGLYEATNRSKITADWVNPLKDHEKLQAVKARLREKETFKDEVEAYKSRIDAYLNDLDGQMKELVQSELEAIGTLGGGIGDSSATATVAPIENMFLQWSSELDAVREEVEAMTLADDPQYSFAVSELKSLYRKFSKSLTDVGGFGTAQVARNPNLPAAQADFLREAGSRYASLSEAIEAESTKLQDLEPLKIDDVLRELGPTSNAILVETDADTMVVDFGSVWPPLGPQAGARARFKNRAFKGEEKLTAAILRATHKEQTAVVFVRYGGQPLFMGGFMPGQPPAPYGTMKTQLEDANFIVEEWDLKSTTTPPEIDPKPTKTIYVVLKPTPPQRPMGQPTNDPPFTDSHRKALLEAMGDHVRALFVAGWFPGPFGAIPASYEYSEYLKDKWGINLDTTALLIQTTSTAPGKYNVTRRDFYSMQEFDVTDHDIVRGMGTSPFVLPWCVPLEVSDSPPEGVEVTPLVSCPAQDGLWGVKNIQKYEDQRRVRDYLTKEQGDLEGPFDLAMAAAKDDDKIVVVSSRDFATDNVAFAREFVLSAQGFGLRSRNPGNVALFINSLHWLNDNTEFVNIGKPIDTAVLEVDKSTTKVVQAVTIVVWPLLALGCGLVAWWVRRR